jgi:hypothetical protein
MERLEVSCRPGVRRAGAYGFSMVVAGWIGGWGHCTRGKSPLKIRGWRMDRDYRDVCGSRLIQETAHQILNKTNKLRPLPP